MPDTQPSGRARLVFLSWSGKTSKAAAAAFREWLPLAIQASQPWMSDLDIEAGARWTPEIAETFSATSVGIVFVTPDNRDRPWLNFEAGAISKSVGENTRVCPYLLGLQMTDVSGPLSQFQMQMADEQGTLRVVEAVNNAIGKPLSDTQLRAIFKKWWPDLAERLKALPSPEFPMAKRPEREILEEILGGMRALLSRPWSSATTAFGFGSGISFGSQPALMNYALDPSVSYDVVLHAPQKQVVIPEWKPRKRPKQDPPETRQ